MHSKVLALAAVSCLFLVSTAQAQFINLAQYDNGTSLSYFLQADINHDGIPDIVGIRPVTQTTFEITVLLGNGTGGFKAAVNTAITAVDNPEGFFWLGDFNGDGYLDVAVFGTNHVTGQNAVAVMLNNGNGTFQAGVQTTVSTPGSLVRPCSATTGDYNGDGKLDFAYLADNGGSNNLLVLPGKGDGAFSAPVETALGSIGGCLAAGDFNNDKKPDIALSEPPGDGIYMLLGKGNGGFDSPVLVGKGGDTIEAADLNHDGNLDLVGIHETTVTVLLGNGTGHFPTTHAYTNPKLAGSGASYQVPFGLSDVNGDGSPDIELLGNTGNGGTSISIFLNNGEGSFTLSNTYNGDGGLGLLVGALTSNGKQDLAFGNSSGGISVMLGNGNGTFQGNTLAGDGGGGSIQAADFNGDHKIDLITNFNRAVLLGNGKGNFTSVNSDCNYFVNNDAIGAFIKGGTLDIAGATSVDDVAVIGVCMGNGNGTFTTGGTFDQGVQHRETLTGDFNNDGVLDLVASDENGISVLLGNGDGTFQNGIPTAVDASYPNFAIGDFNNDGKLDVAAVTSSGVAVFLGNGNGTFKSPIISTGPTSGLPKGVDLNKDGKLDLVITGAGGPVTVMLGKGNGTFAAPVNYTLLGTSTTQAVIGDFNGDGHPDVAVGTAKNGIGIFFGDGTGKLSTTPTFFRVGRQVAGLTTADFNGDGKPDLAAIASGFIVILLNQ